MNDDILDSAESRSHRDNMITMNRGSGFANKNSDLDRQIALLKTCECIKESEVRDLCNTARDILLEESNIQNISSPITVSTFNFQFTDVCIFNRFAEISTANFTT